MPHITRNRYRVLGIDPSTKGFGYAVLEGRGRLIAWGVARLRVRTTKNLFDRVDRLLATYHPDAVALEDIVPFRRAERAKREVERIAGYARLRDVRRVIVSRDDVRRALDLNPTATKHEIASKIVEVVPDLATSLPPKRRLWQSERELMNVFDAAGLAIAALDFDTSVRQAA